MTPTVLLYCWFVKGGVAEQLHLGALLLRRRIEDPSSGCSTEVLPDVKAWRQVADQSLAGVKYCCRSVEPFVAKGGSLPSSCQLLRVCQGLKQGEDKHHRGNLVRCCRGLTLPLAAPDCWSSTSLSVFFWSSSVPEKKPKHRRRRQEGVIGKTKRFRPIVDIDHLGVVRSDWILILTVSTNLTVPEISYSTSSSRVCIEIQLPAHESEAHQISFKSWLLKLMARPRPIKGEPGHIAARRSNPAGLVQLRF